MIVSGHGPTVSEVQAALQRVLADVEFRTSARRSDMLRYLVEKVLEGGSVRLKGISIAIDVFGRDADFDPRVDAIVRGEARRLRQSLASYYVGDGREDPVVISVPKGSYVPQFTYRSAPVAGGPGDPAEAPHEHSADASSALRADVGTVPPDAGIQSPMPASHSGAPRRIFGLPAAVAALLGIVAFVTLHDRAQDDTKGIPDSSVPSVFVEPLAAIGPLEGIETLASGISASLIADLMRFPGFRLYDYGHSLAGQEATDPRASGATGKADFVVRGVLVGTEDDIALAVRLINAADSQIVWSDTFRHPLTPGAIVEMQADVTGQIASRLGGPYGILQSLFTEKAGVAEAGMSSFSCVMQAYAYRQANRAAEYPAVRACLEEAVLRDPGYADAWAMLAILRLDGGRFGYDGTTEEARSRAFVSARTAAAHALSLEPRNAVAMNAIATIEHYSGRFDESLAYSLRAVELNPNDPSTLGYHGWRLVARGRIEEGVPFLHRAMERSAAPLPVFFHMIAVERLMKGDMEGMLTAAQRASVDQSSVSDALLAIAYGGLGLGDEAQDALDRMGKKWPLLAQDPEAAFGRHNLHPEIVEALVEGLRTAGWNPPQPDAESTLGVEISGN